MGNVNSTLWAGPSPCLFKGFACTSLCALSTDLCSNQKDLCRNLKELLRVPLGKVTRTGGDEGRATDELVIIPVEKNLMGIPAPWPVENPQRKLEAA